MIINVAMAKDVMPTYALTRFTNFPMGGNEADLSYKITNIDGLDPGSADVNIDAYADRPGGSFVGAHQPERNIIIDMLLDPKYTEGQTVESLRAGIYAVAAPGRGIELVFTKANGKEYWCKGTVESITTPFFAEENTIRISIICEDPYFYKPTFNELEQNITAFNQDMIISYGGDAPTGFQWVFSINQSSNMAILDWRLLGPPRTWASRDEQRFYLNGGPFASGQTNYVSVNSTRGSKAVSFRKAGVTTNALVNVNSPNSTWPMLNPGPNYLRLATAGGIAPNFQVTAYWREKFMGL